MTTELYPVGSAQRYDFGAPQETPMSRRVEQQAVTPMTEERTRCFFSSGFAADTLPPKLLQAAFEVIDAAFAEDKQIIEGRQRIINLTPADERMFATPKIAAFTLSANLSANASPWSGLILPRSLSAMIESDDLKR